MLLAAGARLGPYEIVAPLGAGGMGEVYRARDTRLNRTVAIKILSTDMAADPQRQARFRREARAISSLTHPHICTLHDVGEQDGVDFLVMEYLAGETLAHRLLRGAMPFQDALRIGAQLADALDAAHRQGLTHRDLKPANVMLAATGAKVLDFGLAKWHEGESAAAISVTLGTVPSTLTQVGAVLGTLQYMAPEQVEGKPADARSDVFALGVILYEMTTGRKAFEGPTATSVMAAILSSTPPPMSTLQPVTPPALDRVVRKCLAKDPSRRWQSAADLRDELAWIADDPAATSTEPTASAAMTVSFQGWSAAVWTTAAAAAVFAVLVALFLGRSASPGLSLPMHFTVLPPDSMSGVRVPIVSPDGRSVAFVARDSDGKFSLWVRPFDSMTARPIVEAEERAFPFWSPDSHFLAFFGEGKLKKIDAGGGPVQIVADNAPSGRGGTWNREDIIVFAPEAEGPLFRISAKGGSPVRVTTLATTSAERSHRFPHFLPDGRHFTYSAQSDSETALMLGTLGSPEVRRLIDRTESEGWAPPGYLLFVRPYPSTTVMAQSFDATQFRLGGEAVPIIDRVRSGARGGNFGFSASDNGVLSYMSDHIPETPLTWVARTGRSPEVVGPKGEYGSVSLAPDGKRAAVERVNRKTGDEEVWIVDLSTGASFPLTSSPPRVTDPLWSPDGTRVAFDRKGASLNSELFVRSSTGIGDAERVTTQLPNIDYSSYDWSADGQFILLGVQERTTVGLSQNLWLLPLDERRARPLLKSAFNKTEARFSPDVRWISYVSDESGASQVYVQSFPELGLRSQVSVAGGSQPRWRRDGKELFYLAADRKLMAVKVRATPTSFEAGVPVVLFDLPNEGSRYDVAADGQRFLITRGVREAAPSPIIVVLNWMAALKK
jgi:eukaryotic-like serine/threonine-protein kinase